MKNNPDYVWCLRHGKRKGYCLAISVCLAAQSNPDIYCPRKCPERNPPDDREDEEKFYPKKEV